MLSQTGGGDTYVLQSKFTGEIEVCDSWYLECKNHCKLIGELLKFSGFVNEGVDSRESVFRKMMMLFLMKVQLNRLQFCFAVWVFVFHPIREYLQGIGALNGLSLICSDVGVEAKPSGGRWSEFVGEFLFEVVEFFIVVDCRIDEIDGSDCETMKIDYLVVWGSYLVVDNVFLFQFLCPGFGFDYVALYCSTIAIVMDKFCGSLKKACWCARVNGSDNGACRSSQI